MKNNNNAILSLKKPWGHNDNAVWLGSTICLTRNLDKYKFPGKLEIDRQKQLINILGKEVSGLEPLKNPTLILADQASPLEKEYLVEHFLSDKSFHQAHVGEAFIIDETGQFLATLNIHDHLCLQIIDTQGELENAWNRLLKMETAIGKAVAYSFSPKFGFLTSDPTICGTALNATVFLQVPALVLKEKVEEILEKHTDESILVTGIQGNPTEIIGDVLAFQNNFTLGVSEENIISNLRTLTTKILVEENRARTEIRHAQDAHAKDQVSRAYGILIHSYQIETVEALNAISLLKFGIEMGWIVGLSFQQVNQLFFNCRRSHLLAHFNTEIPQEELPHKRAEYIHQALKDVHLVAG